MALIKPNAMKKTFLFILLLNNLFTYAQNGFFLQPIVGIGAGGGSYTDINHNEYKTKLVPVYDAQLGIGYQFSHLMINTGIGYMRTGLRYIDVGLSYTMYATVYYNHLVVPVAFGYRFHNGKKSFITPILGVDLTYNYSGRQTAYTQAGVNWNKTMPISEPFFKSVYRPNTWFGVVQLKFDHSLTSRLNIMFMPTINYMFSNMQNYYQSKPQYPNQHNYAVLLNMGIKYTFTKSHKEEKSIQQK